jgi:hypothetical protein
MRRCLKGLGGRPTSTDGFILGPVTRLSGSACLFITFRVADFHAARFPKSAHKKQQDQSSEFFRGRYTDSGGYHMILWKRALLLGFLSWLIPFVASFLVFPLKRWNAALFSTVMVLVVLLVAGVMFGWYFRSRTVTISESLLVGVVWFACNLVLDYPLFSHGPMRMSMLSYYSEIGLAYLIFPLFGFGAARLACSQATLSQPRQPVHP